MTVLYNLRHDGDQYRITKFTDGEVEGSYLVTHSECDCPAGSRPTCRHRQMLPDLLPIIDTHWFWNFDTHTVVDLMGTPKATLDALIAPIVCAPAEQDTMALPSGVQMLTLDGDPSKLWNAIADAVGEPRMPTKPWRRL